MRVDAPDESYEFMREHVQSMTGDNPVLDAMNYWVEWNQMIESAQPKERWRADDLDVETAVRVANSVGREPSISDAQKAIREGFVDPRALNTLKWEDLPNVPAKDAMREMATRYGYDVEHVATTTSAA